MTPTQPDARRDRNDAYRNLTPTATASMLRRRALAPARTPTPATASRLGRPFPSWRR